MEPIELQRPSWKTEYLALLCGVANAGGGTLTLTSPDKGTGRGIHKIRKSFESIPELTQSNLGITCTTEPVMIGGTLCLEISVPPAKEPVSFDGRYYLFVNGQNESLSRERVLQYINAAPEVSWELRVQASVTLDDAEPYMVARFTEGINGASQNTEAGFDGAIDTSTVEALSTARLKDARSDKLTNAGVLLLSRHPDEVIPGAFVRVGLFDSVDYTVQMEEEIRGTLLSQLERTVDAIYDRFLPRVNQDGGSSTPPPLTAVSEAIRNALVHKNYESPEPVRVLVHPDKITVENAGRPPATWTVSDLMGRHVSRPQNPILAAALQDVGEFNGWGYGIATMSQACTSAGLPQPELSIGEKETAVSFAFAGGMSGYMGVAGGGAGANAGTGNGISQAVASRIAAATGNPPAMNNVVSHAMNARAQNVNIVGDGNVVSNTQNTRYVRPTDSKNAPFRERSIAALNDLNLTGTDEYVLKVLIANGRATAANIAEFIGVSESTVRRSFRKLRKYELIERVGSDKAGYWKVLF